MGSTTYLTSCFAEYNSMDLNGSPIDISKRISWSYQLPKSDVDTHFSTTAVYAKSYSTTFEPTSISISPETPTGLSINGQILSWNTVNNVTGYLVYVNLKLFVFTKFNLYICINTIRKTL